MSTVRRTRLAGRPPVGPSAWSLAAAVTACAVLAGCTAVAGDQDATPPADASGAPSSAPPAAPLSVRTNLPGRADVPVDTLLRVSAEHGELSRLRVTGAGERLPGRLEDEGAGWRATERLEPGARYTITGVGVREDGTRQRVTQSFTTQALTLDQQTFASIAPLDGETVGVGMPVVVTFDIPVSDRAAAERHLSVRTTPEQAGTWHWVSDSEVHWRPKDYWRPGTRVRVVADLNGVDVGGGVYGQHDRSAAFRIGDDIRMEVDVATHRMRVLRNGELLRTIPISAGKPGFTTRSGVKVIIEKFRTKNMDAATTGIDPGDPEYYNMSNVEYAQRVTYSGEFLHAAPWSVGSQGSANVSHGCVGMSTADAAWLYALTKRGDVVEVVGTDRPMEPTNGYGDWNVSWKDYRAASALHG